MQCPISSFLRVIGMLQLVTHYSWAGCAMPLCAQDGLCAQDRLPGGDMSAPSPGRLLMLIDVLEAPCLDPGEPGPYLRGSPRIAPTIDRM